MLHDLKTGGRRGDGDGASCTHNDGFGHAAPGGSGRPRVTGTGPRRESVPSLDDPAGDYSRCHHHGTGRRARFTDAENNMIGRVNGGRATEYPVPTASSGVDGIALGSDGNIWYTEPSTNKVGRINPSNPTGDNVDWSITASPGSSPTGIAAVLDGDLWITQSSTGQIGQFSPSDPTAVTETTIPSPNAPARRARTTAGPDKDLWFTDSPNEGGTTGAKIGRINPSTHTVAVFLVGTKDSFMEGITAGSDGNLWYIENNSLAGEGSLVNSISTTGGEGSDSGWLRLG